MAAPAPRLHYIPELLEIHADELAYLWGQRRAAIFDARYTLPGFLELNERVEAHLAGLLAVPGALPGLLGKRLTAAQDRDEAFAAAAGLLRLPHPAGGWLEVAAPLPPHMRESFAFLGFEAAKTPKPKRTK